MYKRVLKHICYFDKYQQAWKRVSYLSLINRLITHKIFLQALRDASEQLKQRALLRCWGVRCLDSVAVASSPLFSYRVTMFASLVFSGTSPPSSTGREFGRAWWRQRLYSISGFLLEYYPGRRFPRWKWNQGLFQILFSWFTVQVLHNRFALYGVFGFLRHHFLSLWYTAQSNVQSSASSVALGPGLSRLKQF